MRRLCGHAVTQQLARRSARAIALGERHRAIDQDVAIAFRTRIRKPRWGRIGASARITVLSVNIVFTSPLALLTINSWPVREAILPLTAIVAG